MRKRGGKKNKKEICKRNCVDKRRIVSHYGGKENDVF